MANPEVPTPSTDARELTLDATPAELAKAIFERIPNRPVMFAGVSAIDQLANELKAWREAYRAHKNKGLAEKAASEQQEKDRLIIGRIADWVCGKRLDVKNAKLGQLVIALTECIEVQSNAPFDRWLKSYNEESCIERNGKQ